MNCKLQHINIYSEFNMYHINNIVWSRQFLIIIKNTFFPVREGYEKKILSWKHSLRGSLRGEGEHSRPLGTTLVTLKMVTFFLRREKSLT